MTTLCDIIANTREDTIEANYNAAIEQINSLVAASPFETTFTITAGCISQEMTKEIAKRFNNGGIKSIVTPQGGMYKSGWSILITAPLLPYLTNED